MRRFNIPTRSPKDLWREIESEAGPLHQIDIDGMKRALELAAVEARIRGESVIQVLAKLASACSLTLEHSNAANHCDPNTDRGKTGGCAGGSRLRLLNLIVAGASCRPRAYHAMTLFTRRRVK